MRIRDDNRDIIPPHLRVATARVRSCEPEGA
jgi:hypothetical protein